MAYRGKIKKKNKIKSSWCTWIKKLYVIKHIKASATRLLISQFWVCALDNQLLLAVLILFWSLKLHSADFFTRVTFAEVLELGTLLQRMLSEVWMLEFLVTQCFGTPAATYITCCSWQTLSVCPLTASVLLLIHFSITVASWGNFFAILSHSYWATKSTGCHALWSEMRLWPLATYCTGWNYSYTFQEVTLCNQNYRPSDFSLTAVNIP